ncbi:hypothetical protein G7Y79_00020g048360 [Physcia stellaris]|nr:hypothetical protein G7Y79_00020g048360 [Physcia stellaris]
MASQWQKPQRPTRLEIPDDINALPLHQSDHESDYDDKIVDDALPEEDIQSVIGVAISQAQTRLMSPNIPAAEKVAAFEDMNAGAQFDGAADYQLADEGASEQVDQSAEPIHFEEETTKPVQRKLSDTSDHALRMLPSPWTASPKLFERPRGQRRGRASSKPWPSPTGVLADMNVKRFMSTFNLPSLPRTPTLKDFSIPSVASVFGGKEDEKTHNAATRQKRPTSVLLTKSQGSTGKRSSPSRTSPHGENVEDKASDMLYGTPVDHSPSSDKTIPRIRRDDGQSTDASEETTSTRSTSDLLAPKSPVLRRATSDQSLVLRRATSTGSSLGDDSRWENVQEQVNSRMKAIKDTLQDSSIKLPSMPNLANMNLNSLRPEFLRARGSSDPNQRFGNRGVARPAHVILSDSNCNLESRSQKIENDIRLPKRSPKSMHPNLDRALEDLTGDLVIMGGYRGSILRSSKPPYRQLWVPVKVGLNIRKVNLEVGLNPEDEEHMHETVFASGMLSHIGPVDMGRRLLKRTRDSPNCQNGKLRVHDYGWDWRLSPHLLCRRLIGFLEQLPCNAKGVPAHERGATVIAHSMGGLITRHAVNQRPELFAGVVYAGVPQHCINILGPLRKGDEVLLSSKVLTAQVNFTLRTSFLLLPEDGKCFVNKETKEPYPVDFFNVESWKNYALSPCIAPALPPFSHTEKKGMFSTVYNSLPSLPQPLKRITAPTSADASLDAAKEAPAPTTSSLSNSNSTAINPSIQSTIPLPLALTYLSRTLASILTFKRELTHNPALSAENSYPPLSILYSTNVPTVFAARVASREAIRCADAYDDLQFASGDGVCLAKAAQLPPGYEMAKGGKVKSERGHVGLLGDLEGVGRCLGAVGRARREQGVGLGREWRGDVGVGEGWELQVLYA